MGELRTTHVGADAVATTPSELRTTHAGADVAVVTTPNQNLRITHIGADVVYPGGAIPPGEVTFTDEGFIGLTWVEFKLKTGSTEVWSKNSLDDPLTYYFGYKTPRIIEWGRIMRSLSDRNGQTEGSDFTFTASDNDRRIRTLLAAPSTKYFPNRSMVVRMIDDPSRRLLITPRTVMRGLVSGYKPSAPLEFQFTVQDMLSRKFMSSQSGEEAPRRKITITDFPQCAANYARPTDGSIFNVGAEGKSVPIIYGTYSDQTIQNDTVPTSNVFPLDSTIPVPNQYGANDVSGGSLEGWVTGRVCAVIGGSESEAVVGGATFQSAGITRSVRFFWEAVPGATSYHIYVSEHGGWDPHRGVLWFTDVPVVHGRRIDHSTTPGPPVLLNGADYSGLYADITSWTDGIDVLAGGTTTVATDHGKGLIKPIYVGDYTIGGVIYQGALIAGHACKALVAGYYNDFAVDLATHPEWLTPNNPTAWAAAGFTTPYTDINGRRYFIIYLKGTSGETLKGNLTAPSGEPGISVNVQGIEDAGDGSGTLVEQIHQQYLHLMTNWVLGDYQSGGWLAIPTYDDLDAIEQIDASSFDASTTIAMTRLTNGYPGAFVIGLNGDSIRIRELVAQMNLSADCDSGQNRKGQFMIDMITEADAFPVNPIVLTDVESVNKDTFDVSDDLQSHFNKMPYYWKRDASGRQEQTNGANGFLGIGTLNDLTSQSLYNAVLVAPSLELEMIREDAVAQDIVARRMTRMKDPPRIVRIQTGLRGANYEIGDIVSLTHYGGVGSDGWSNQPMRIQRHELNPNDYTVTLECMDLKQLLQSAFILGDETALPGTWTSATDLEQIYGYLADETTGLFSDGSPGKRLR